MHALEPYYNWRDFYTAENDRKSPFYRRLYSEFSYTHSVYNYMIHPQWDEIGSPTLYMKLLFCDYDKQFAILELFGEWNDCINNDSMHLKRNIIDHLSDYGINKFILIGENVMNFHFEMDDYFAEWFEDVEEGWIAALNFREHVYHEFEENNLDQYFIMGGKLDVIDWRTMKPQNLFDSIELLVTKRIGTL